MQTAQPQKANHERRGEHRPDTAKQPVPRARLFHNQPHFAPEFR
jgi:hypothetical protein